MEEGPILRCETANGLLYILENIDPTTYRIVVFNPSVNGPTNQSALLASSLAYANEIYNNFVSTAHQVELEKQQISPSAFDQMVKTTDQVAKEFQSIVYNWVPVKPGLIEADPLPINISLHKPVIPAEYFSEISKAVSIPSQFCPICDAVMARRKGKFGDFWACSNWKKTGCIATCNAEGKPSKKTIQYLSAKGKKLPPVWTPPKEPTELELKIRSIDIE